MAKKKQGQLDIRSSAAEYLTFVAATGDSQTSVEMRYEDENIWLTQKMMAELYDVTVSTINQHLKRIFDDSELQPDAVIKDSIALRRRHSEPKMVPRANIKIWYNSRHALVAQLDRVLPSEGNRAGRRGPDPPAGAPRCQPAAAPVGGPRPAAGRGYPCPPRRAAVG